jgi:hypothetical protein
MTQQHMLSRVANKEISPRKAYREMYPKQKTHRPRRAHFVKMAIRTNESRGVDILLSILFFLPVPMFIVRFAIRRMKQNMTITDGVDVSPEDLARLVGYRGIKVIVKTHDGVKVNIRTV